MRREIFKVDTFVKLIVSIFVIIFLTQTVALARSGCCSSHGGVCGCSCCDGKALSPTCAPYYPLCNNTNYSKPPIKPVITKPIIKTYSETEYTTIVSEKNKLVNEKNTIVSEKETLIQDLENVKKELSTIKQEKEEKEKEISQLKKASEEKGILSTIDQTETTLVKPNKQAPAKNNNSEGSGTIPFLLGSGLVYGAGRLKRKQEMKKEGVQIKGNITRDGQKIYYTIDSRYYDMVKIDKKKGEKWFLSEAEATNAGWHKA